MGKKNVKKYGGSKSKCMVTGDGRYGKAMDASDSYGERNTVYGKLMTSNRERHPMDLLAS